MSCSNATAPINIVYNLAKDCQLKCDYEPHYDFTTVSAENKGEYIAYTFGETNTATTFNTEIYNVTEMRLYHPSLHQYGGKATSAEILISHINVSRNTRLIVCIPVEIGESLEESLMESLIGQVVSRANTEGGITAVDTTSFTISSLVPLKPYYSYNGTTPFNPCNETANYVVFDKSDSIKISSSSLKDLKSIINPNSYQVKENTAGYFYNKNGPIKSNNSDDDIYIDCRPAGSEGKTIVYDQSFSINNDKPNAKEIFENLYKNWFVQMMISILIMTILIKVWNYMVDKYKPVVANTAPRKL